jgi:uncharacterized protein YqgC (DUF456 family)
VAAEIALWSVLALAWLSILLGAPGTLMMLLAACVYGWATGFREITPSTLGWLAAISLPAELLDQFLGFWAARRYGASWTGMAGGFVGGLIGATLLGGVLPVVGVVPGALIGSFAGAYLAELATRRDPPLALRAAWGSFLGKIAGIALKMGAGVLMAIMVYRALH